MLENPPRHLVGENGTAELRDDITSCLARLASAERHYLRDLPGLDVPRLPGIYALWCKDELLYTGLARVDPSTTNNPQAAGVAGRLSTYRNCRLTSDFAIAVAFRFVVPSLSHEDRSRLASSELGVRAIQAMTKQWVATNVKFSVDAVAPAIAIAAESAVRRSGLAGSGTPAFKLPALTPSRPTAAEWPLRRRIRGDSRQ